jgi:hypothetical protein
MITLRLSHAILLVCLPTVHGSDWLLNPEDFRARVSYSAAKNEIEFSNDLARRVFRVGRGAGTIALDNLMTKASLLRSVRPEAVLVVDGKTISVGGLEDQPVHNYVDPVWLARAGEATNSLAFTGWSEGVTRQRFPVKFNERWIPAQTTGPGDASGASAQARKVAWPPPGKALTLSFATRAGAQPSITVRVNYEMYDGLPLLAKWLTVSNSSAGSFTLNSVVVEQLAVVEPESIVDGTPANFRGTYRELDVFSDYSFGGNMTANADAPAVRWKTDPLYATQVHYERQTPCLLECAPPFGPEIQFKPGETFESFHVFELIQDSTDRERRGLATRRAYRALAPWVQENPILMHVRSARPEAVKLAIDQCADVGFEMVILTFGSGFDIENEKPEYLEQLRDLAGYARTKGIVLGGYSLLASRSINAENDAINPATGKPGGARFGNSPCIGSAWGTNYFRKLRQFFETTGCGILEHDGSYPGDVCASTNHPGHRGLGDSQWEQWQVVSGFYQWCRARGIYLNVPDWYYLAGSSKCGMGYRESNWSLPRPQQEIIERQNIYDGTWEKTPSMGWMFVPLTEYQGGGAAATIEPLRDHLDHYETRLANLFGAGVQACYRGPRLYDSGETRAVVKRWVEFYLGHRAILDSDLVHLRRADARDWDGWLHVNPRLPERGLAMFYNPLGEEIEREIRLPLYYTGLTDDAMMRFADGRATRMKLDPDRSVMVRVKIPARNRTWVIIESPHAPEPRPQYRSPKDHS